MGHLTRSTMGQSTLRNDDQDTPATGGEEMGL